MLYFCSRYLFNLRNLVIIIGTSFLLIIVYINQLSSVSLQDVIQLSQNVPKSKNLRYSFSRDALRPGPKRKREFRMMFRKSAVSNSNISHYKYPPKLDSTKSSMSEKEGKNNSKSETKSNILNNIEHREAFSSATQKGWNISTEVQKTAITANQLKNNVHKYSNADEDNNTFDKAQQNAPDQTKWINISSQIMEKLKQPNHLHKSSIFSQKRLKILKETIKKLHNLKQFPLYESFKNVQLFESYKNKNFTRNMSIICQEYNIEGSLDRIVRPNMWESINSPQNYTDVTLVTQISTERLWVLERLLGNWEGPMSVAMYLRRDDLDKMLSLMWAYPRVMSRANLDMHLVLQNGVRFIYLYLFYPSTLWACRVLRSSASVYVCLSTLLVNALSH